MSRFRVLLADPIDEAGAVRLREDDRFEVVECSGLAGPDLVRALADVDAVIVRTMTRITRESLAGAERLRAIGRAGVGLDNIDVDAATEKGIAVFNTPAANSVSAAELTFALILALARRIPAADRSMKTGEWDRSRFTGFELHGRTLGLVGVGRIGGEVAKRARCFGMRVVANDPLLEEARARELGVEPAPLEEVLRRADVLSLHVPLTAETAGLIDEERLRLMKPSAVLVNVARGGVVDEAALVRALEEGRLAGAALDVYAEEPLPPGHPLRCLGDKVILVPHIGAATLEAKANVAVEIVDAIRAALLDGDLSRAVNADALAD